MAGKVSVSVAARRATRGTNTCRDRYRAPKAFAERPELVPRDVNN
ncbi:hypothetical protein GCM10028801_28070 [Nocardioides maradonensis]